jgi:hypothetical protein
VHAVQVKIANNRTPCTPCTRSCLVTLSPVRTQCPHALSNPGQGDRTGTLDNDSTAPRLAVPTTYPHAGLVRVKLTPHVDAGDAPFLLTLFGKWPQCIVDPQDWPHMDAIEKLLQKAHAIRARKRLMMWLALDAQYNRPLYLTQAEAVALVTALTWLPPPLEWPTSNRGAGACDPAWIAQTSAVLSIWEALDTAGVYPE